MVAKGPQGLRLRHSETLRLRTQSSRAMKSGSSKVEGCIYFMILQGANTRLTQKARVQGGKMQQNIALLCLLRCLFESS
jgi:hypothetical protein